MGEEKIRKKKNIIRKKGEGRVKKNKKIKIKRVLYKS